MRIQRDHGFVILGAVAIVRDARSSERPRHCRLRFQPVLEQSASDTDADVHHFAADIHDAVEGEWSYMPFAGCISQAD